MRARKSNGTFAAEARTVREKFEESVERTDTCWLWRGTKVKGGYGVISIGPSQTRLAHRIAYELFVGPIPEGLTLDHVTDRGCVSTSCVNPAHLEPVTMRENILRSSGLAVKNAKKTVCDNGHPFSEENTYIRPSGHRDCKPCVRARGAAYRKRVSARSVRESMTD